MRTLIYYFTGTGNSLAVARDLAERMDAELVSIVAVDGVERITPDADCIGFVFPVYHRGVPVAVRQFVTRLEGLAKKPLFAVCTYGNDPGSALRRFSGVIAETGGRLSRSYTVRMPHNYLRPAFTSWNFYKTFRLSETLLSDQKEMFWIWEMRREWILKDLELMRKGVPGTRGKVSRDLSRRPGFRDGIQKSVWLKVAGYEGEKPRTFDEGIALMDHGFWSDEKCTGCGTCSRVCPKRNISMVKGRPEWNHQCEQCFACLHWCPQEALQFREATSGRSRYHHPEVNLLDILSRLQVAEVQLGIEEEGGRDV
jgi:ferredoxin